MEPKIDRQDLARISQCAPQAHTEKSGLRVPTGITASFFGLSQDDGDHGNEAFIPVGALRGGLADLLKERTGPLHRQAERSGIIQDLLQGRAGRRGYGLLLRNLLPVYEALEQSLDRQRNTPLLSPFARPDLYRAPALRADLDHVSGPDWGSLPLLPAAQSYGQRILQAGVEDGALLIAHAYVRYLGDLNGGQILKRLLGRHLGLGSAGLAFYDFPTLADLQVTAQDYRAAIDRAGAAIDHVEGVLNEACVAFRFTINLSEEVAVQDNPSPVQTGR